eukprot:11792146-Alexandrium_andersonii.AAC.1
MASPMPQTCRLPSRPPRSSTPRALGRTRTGSRSSLPSVGRPPRRPQPLRMGSHWSSRTSTWLS